MSEQDRFTIEKEILVREGRYIPDIFVVRSGNVCMSAPCPPEEDVRWEYPDALIFESGLRHLGQVIEDRKSVV